MSSLFKSAMDMKMYNGPVEGRYHLLFVNLSEDFLWYLT